MIEHTIETERAAVAAWQAADARMSAAALATYALTEAYECIGGWAWNTPPAIEALGALRQELAWAAPVRPWDKNFSVAKVERAARKMDRLAAHLEQATTAARS